MDGRMDGRQVDVLGGVAALRLGERLVGVPAIRCGGTLKRGACPAG